MEGGQTLVSLSDASKSDTRRLPTRRSSQYEIGYSGSFGFSGTICRIGVLLSGVTAVALASLEGLEDIAGM